MTGMGRLKPSDLQGQWSVLTGNQVRKRVRNLKSVRVAGIIGAFVFIGAISAGCGPTKPVLPTKHQTIKNTPSNVSASQSAMAPRTLNPQSLVGHAISALQNHRTWVTIHAHRNLIVETSPSTSRPHLVIPYPTIDCAGSGMLSHVGFDTVVTGCTNLWVLHQNHWIARTLPSFLGSAASITGTGHRWWFLAYGAGASGNESIAIWTSTNEGASWTRLATSSNQPHALPYYGDKTGLAADPQGNLWLTGTTMGLGYGWLYYGRADARRWSSSPLPVPNKWANSELASYPPVFPSDHRGFLPVTVNGTFNGLAIYSRDQATNRWKLTGAIPGPVGTTQWDFTASSSTSLWVTVGHQLWVSHDAGITWHDAWKTPPRWDLVSVTFSGPRDGDLLAVRSSGNAYALWMTHDGGKAWRALRTPQR